MSHPQQWRAADRRVRAQRPDPSGLRRRLPLRRGGPGLRAAPAHTPAPTAMRSTVRPGSRRALVIASCRAPMSAPVCILSSCAETMRSGARPRCDARAAEKSARPGAARTRSMSARSVDARSRHSTATFAAATANTSSIASDAAMRSRFLPPCMETVAWNDSPPSGKFAQLNGPNPYSSSVHRHSSAPPALANGNPSLMPWPGLASLVTTSARWIAPERRNPSATCSAVSGPQTPLAMSKENVPWVPGYGSSGLAPISSWIIAASAGSPRLRSR